MKRVEERYKAAAYDVLVVGGGMSGLCAAISAARNGAKTALVNSRPVLGGNASSEIRIHISSATQGMKQFDYEETGLLYELMLENKSVNDYFNYSVWDTVLYQTALKEKNLTLYQNTVMYDCETQGDQITGVLCVQETTEMRLNLTADVYIDCTGNGTLGFYAGAQWRQGSESKSEFGEPHAPEAANNDRMGNTIMLKAMDVGHPVKFTPPPFAKHLTEEQLRFRVHSKKQKVDTSAADDPEEYARLSTFSSSAVDYGYWWLELMGDGDDIIADFETIRDDLLAYAYGVWDHIKNGGDHGADNFTLEWMGALPGMRESRRLMGDYILTETDIMDRRVFDDAIAYGGWPVDLHAPHGLLDFDLLPSQCHTFNGVYTVPYRCYYSKNISNLMMAGRDISTTRLGLASTRILGCCAIGGQAVGAAAAMCSEYKVNPRELAPHIPELQQIILKDDGFIPGVTNNDKKDLARTASFNATSFKPSGAPFNVVNGISRRLGENTNAWVSDGIGKNGETLTMAFGKVQTLSQLRLTFDSDFHYPLRITMSPNRQAQQRIGVPAELVKDYTVFFRKNGAVVKTVEVKDNHQRHNVLDFDTTECDTVEVTVHSTNGAKDVTVFEIRAY